jgi:hypothetical protein
MRQYDDPVEVRRGDAEDPDQFLWRGRLWKVRTVVAHWVETGPWWPGAQDASATDPLSERELWRVEAGRGPGPLRAARAATGDEQVWGVFDLSLDWTDGRWQLVGGQD